VSWHGVAGRAHRRVTTLGIMSSMKDWPPALGDSHEAARDEFGNADSDGQATGCVIGRVTGCVTGATMTCTTSAAVTCTDGPVVVGCVAGSCLIAALAAAVAGSGGAASRAGRMQCEVDAADRSRARRSLLG
jgi:hypothetical protein